jgi:phosphatidylinositol alpha 1,6-mannosyltransferase
VVVGYVGSLHKRNGVRRLPELTQIPGVRLVVIGDGPQKSWLRAHLPGAKFLSAMERGELAIAIASLDVLVHPGALETDCHVLREAAASSVPVVAPEAGGAPEVVRHDGTGLLYDPTEDDGLRRAVAVLTGDEAQRAVLGGQARAATEARDWTVAADELIEVHYAALSRSTSAVRTA